MKSWTSKRDCVKLELQFDHAILKAIAFVFKLLFFLNVVAIGIVIPLVEGNLLIELHGI